MKFCSKCGKEIHDEAVVCIHCGCATENQTFKQTVSEDYNRLMAFVNEVKTIHLLGIVSLVLCLGIGLIFQIINVIKINKYTDRKAKAYKFPEFNLTNPSDIALYESTKKKFKTASTMTSIGFGISTSLILFAVWFGIMSSIM